MTVAIILFGVTIISMIAGILFFPTVKVSSKISVGSYWVIALTGAVAMLLFCGADVGVVLKSFVSNSAVNPIKILILFLSMTIISVFLDELGLFEALASFTLKKAGTSQKKLFAYLYIIVAVLTIFTSNDVIILSFTPFICYFCKRGKISPMPYLAAEFVAANTWSMALVIGNPTNIYLATYHGIDFISYFKVMALPTLFAGSTAFSCLYLFYSKKLKTSVDRTDADAPTVKDKPCLIFGVIVLSACVVGLAISSYIDIEMWLISFGAAVVLTVFSIIYYAAVKKPPIVLKDTLKRAPWQIVPFVISMFAVISVLEQTGVTTKLSEYLYLNSFTTFSVGIAAFLASNLINNIPMSVLFAPVTAALPQHVSLSAVYAAIIGSNLGALLTPVGALAGIMFSSILTSYDVKFKYRDFLILGATVAIPSLCAALVSLWVII